MYVPRFNAADESWARALVAEVGAGELVSTGPDGYPLATLLPVLWRGDLVVAHLARANPHWRALGDGAPALLVCTGPQAYVHPGWYPAKGEHGKVVPTWNYSSVHLRGTARVIEDAGWLREAVTALTDRHEAGLVDRWRVSDAPAGYVDGMLRAIVGVELRVERIEAKAKLSQNRSEADRRGVIEGLGEHPVAEAMRRGEADFA
ncbi:FMN-binding negative transcriptional regulator [Nocardioides sp. BP30]|uniref:FMN-binding negative transcriptional regulator n=1 Tax=Nocardioides sp. BP30 TaxID=3036374 RepID=UPI00246993B9|nr:FMN-binding negative transcriptional regulator [Nocardioides sp. BP30]WGL53572.1 FMN-binding negative transcriptional regulator [Nocardioides sp. BP30]